MTFQFPHPRETSRVRTTWRLPEFQFPHTRETWRRQPVQQRQLFQFPHTRETFLVGAKTGEVAVSIPAHTGNIIIRQDLKEILLFNSRTHGKHLTGSLSPHSKYFQFPHTRETLPSSCACKAISFSIPAHTGNIVLGCEDRLFDFFNSRTHGKHLGQHGRCTWKHFNSRTHGKHSGKILKTGYIWYNALFTFINNVVFYLIFKQ